MSEKQKKLIKKRMKPEKITGNSQTREYRALEDLARDEINRFLGKLSLKTGKE